MWGMPMDSNCKIRRLYLCRAAALLLASIHVPVPAMAQVDEIVVSVRKKSENLQDVPMAVTVIGSEEIERQGIRNVADVAKLNSSLQFDESFAQSDTRITVRGLSPTRGRQNIATLIDGIDVSSEAITSSGGSLLINTRLIDIERIEVVLGPQMALYGRSAFNGALQYITRDPSEEFEVDFRVDVNDLRGYEAVAAVSGPILGDTLGYRLNATWWDQEGFYENSITNETVGSNNGWGAAFTLKFEPTDNLSFKWRTEYTDDQSQPSPQAFLPFNADLNTPAGAYVAGVATCNSALVDALSDWDDPNNANQGVPGNNQAYLDRGLRIQDPAYVATLDPNTLDPTLETFEIPAGGGPYCEELVSARVGEIPDASELTVAMAPDPTTPGVDYVGFDRELFRTSLVASWESERFSITSLTGFTTDENSETQDINAFAFLDESAGPYLDGNPNSFSFNNDKETQQISQDLRFTTSFEGPVNGTIGALYWNEDVDNDSKSVTAEASGSHCFWNSGTGGLNPINIDDGCTAYTEAPVGPYQNAVAPFRPTSPANRDTEHFSIYGNLDIDLAENWTVSLEGRYNDEEVTVEGPVFLDPGASGGPGGLNPCGIFFRGCQPYDDYIADGRYFGDAYFPWTDEDQAGNDLGFYRLDDVVIDDIPIECWQQNTNAILTSIQEGPALIETTGTQTAVTAPDGTVYMVDTPELGTLPQDEGQAAKQRVNGQAVVNPNSTDYFNPWCRDSLVKNEKWLSPKITLDWAPTDDMLIYGSWSRAQKPGGFSLLTVGSSGLNRELAEFEPEIMEVWELGANTAWLDGTIIVNGSLFFQDFTDKQALTSALGTDGRLVSKIENAGAAEVWGTEFNIAWEPLREFLAGNWRFGGGITWLATAEYTDFEADSTSHVTAANAGNCTPTQVGAGTVCSVSYTGNELENAPKVAFSGMAGYYHSMSSAATAYVETDFLWQDKRYTSISNNLWTKQYSLLNLRLGVRNERWETLLYINNVLDNDTVQFASGGPGLGCCFVLGSEIDLQPPPDGSATVNVELPLYNSAFMPRPRIVGFRMSFRFGG
jgi:outer membrane receptor protein involved in Fe transport